MKSLIQNSFQISQDYYPESYVLLRIYCLQLATDTEEMVTMKSGEGCCHKRAFDIYYHMERSETMAIKGNC